LIAVTGWGQTDDKEKRCRRRLQPPFHQAGESGSDRAIARSSGQAATRIIAVI